MKKIASLVGIATFLLLFASHIFANTYTVINTLDSGAGSLREAITNANSHSGADTVAFNIPQSDAGYNSSEGVWTINLLTSLPFISGEYTFLNGNSQASNQGNTNVFGPEISIHPDNSNVAGLQLFASNCSICGLIISGYNYGIQFIFSASSNSITDCYIGTNFNGTLSVPNQYGVVYYFCGSGNIVANCLISGNVNAGVGVSSSNGSIVKGNKIGTDRTGTHKLSNNYGIAIDNSSNTIIGGSTITDLNLISGNTTSGIVVNGNTSAGTQIKGNYIGTELSGTDSLPNGCGVILNGSHNNTIGSSVSAEKNIISGNYQAGIILNGSGTSNNSIKGNYIGTNKNGDNFISNHTGIMLKSNSNKNQIGGTSAAERNIISGNLEIGVYIEASDSNTIQGNYLGPDVSGNATFMISDSAVQGNGIELNTVSKYNTVGGSTAAERNIISGNRVYGLIYYGNSSNNFTNGNYIGVNAAGNQRLENATGICVDGGSNHNQINNNVLSGNKSYGIFFVTTGTYYNEFKGNFVGVNATNTDTIPNYIGVIIAAGTKYNTIGGVGAGEANIISGNYYDGIEISDAGTDENIITGNIIGAATPGGFGNFNGIGIATHPRKNIISHNTISGNKYVGIILFEHADSNRIENNKIGVCGTNNDSCGNKGCGIAIVQGSSHNYIGPGNIIACNDSAGIVITDNNSLYNTISQSAVYHNGFTQIDILPAGLNANDAGDADSGPNNLMNYPVIVSTGYNPTDGYTYVPGTIDYNYESPAGIIIEIFRVYNDSLGSGNNMEYIGSTPVNASGQWSFFTIKLHTGDSIVATATDIHGNTSEISPKLSVVTGINNLENKDVFAEIFPVPAKDFFIIKLNSIADKNVNIRIIDINGKEIQKIISCHGLNSNDEFTVCTENFTSGLYFVTVETSSEIITRKISIIK